MSRLSFASASLKRITTRSDGLPKRANPVESGPRCFIDWSIAVVSDPMSLGPSRWMMPAIPHIGDRAPLWRRRGPARPFLRKDIQVFLDVPVADGRQEAGPLVALV